jgi:hypothetical protein
LRLLRALGAIHPPFPPQTIPLSHTPRKAVVEPHTGNVILIETDHNAFTETETKAMSGDGGGGGGGGGSKEGGEGEEEEETVDPAVVGALMPDQPGKWASCIRVLNVGAEDPADVNVLKLDLDDNEAAFSVRCWPAILVERTQPIARASVAMLARIVLMVPLPSAPCSLLLLSPPSTPPAPEILLSASPPPPVDIIRRCASPSSTCDPAGTPCDA